MVVLPLVPVTPMSSRRPDGCRYTQSATSPSRARGSATTNTGSPHPRAAARPPGSVRTATAPACGRVRAELGAVVVTAGQRHVQVAGPDAA